MDSSFKKKGGKPKETQNRQGGQAYQKLTRHSFRQIQHQFSKNRNNHQKALESLERINASSQEKMKKSGIMATDQSMNMDSLSNAASSIRQNSTEKDDSQIIHSRNKIYTETNIQSYRSNHQPYRTHGRLNKTLHQALQSGDTSQDLKKLKQKLQQQQSNFRSRLYDHQVYIKQLLKQIDELSYAWSQSRQMLQQMRLQKQALERQMRKDREQFNLLRQVLVKQNNYYKNEIRIHQRETAQLRDRLSKLAGLKSAYQMDHIEQKEQFTEQQQMLIDKVTQLSQKIKEYSVQIGQVKTYEQKILSLDSQIKELRVQLAEKEEIIKRQQNIIRVKSDEMAAKQQEITKNNDKINEITKQIQLKQDEITFLKNQQQAQQVSLKKQQINQQTITKLNTTISQLKEQLEQSANRQQFLSSSLSQKTIEANNLVTLVVQVNTTVNEKNNTIAELQEKFEESVKKVETLNESIMTFTKEIWSLKGTEAGLAAKNEELTSQLNKLKKQGSNERELQDKIKKIQEQAQQMKDELQQKLMMREEELRIIKSNKQIPQTPIQPQKHHKQTMTIMNVNSTQSNTEIPLKTDAQITTQPHQNQQLTILRQQSQQNKQEIQKMSHELGRAISLTDHLQSKQQTLLRQLEATNSTKDQHQQKINEMLNKINNLQQELGKTSYSKQTFQKKYEDIVDQFDKFRSDYDKLAQQKEFLEQKIQNLQKQSEMSQIQMDQLTQQLQSLKQRHQQLLSKQDQQCEECKKMEKEMNRLRSQLSVTKYGYEDRILRMEDQHEELKNVVTRIRAYSKENF